MNSSPMDELRAYITQITQELMELNSGKETTRTRPKLSLKNAFAHNFWALVKVYFSSPKQANCMIYTIMIPTQLTNQNLRPRSAKTIIQDFSPKSASLVMTPLECLNGMVSYLTKSISPCSLHHKKMVPQSNII
jgi:hypothetical protein